MSDPIADMIIRIKNAYLARKVEVVIPHSKIKEAIGRILVDSSYVSEMKIEDIKPQKNIVLTLNYINKKPAVTDVKRISKPGRRMYAPADQLPRALGGYGVTIISTSKGVMTDKEARKKNVGGEVLCQIW